MPIITTDPIADMITRIRNAVAVQKAEIVVPHSKVKESIAKLLVDNKFLSGVEVIDGDVGKILKIAIHAAGENARINEVDRLSKPGRRWYVSTDDIPTIKRGRGLVIVSTSKGMMTGKEAIKQRLGGELICKVY